MPEGLRKSLSPEERDVSRTSVTRKPSMGDRMRRSRRKRPSQNVLEWHKGKVIGQGGFGTVYLGLDARSGQLVAGKEFNFDVSEARKAELLGILEKEISTMRRLAHPNIVRYIGADRVDDHFYIFMEYVAGGSLRSLLDEFGSLQLPVVSSFARQIVLGLQYLHDNEVIHRDIKSANVLVNIDGVLKLADFGSAQTFDEGRGMQGTPYWMAPEVIRGETVTWAADIWSLGCVIVEMFTGQRPFAQLANAVQALNFIVSSEEPVPIPEQCDRMAGDFLSQCFQRHPADRPSASVLLGHPFLTVWSNEGSYDHSAIGSHSFSVVSDRNVSTAGESVTERPAEQVMSQSALADEMRNALVRMTMSHSGSPSNPLRLGRSNRSQTSHTPVVAAAPEGPHMEEIANLVLPSSGEGDVLLVQLDDDNDEMQDAAVNVRDGSAGESDDDSCSNQRKAQLAVLLVLLAALAIISTLLGLKS